MNFSFKFFVNVLGIALLSGCVRDTSFPLPTYKQRLVMLALFNPDSIMKVTLSKSLPVLDASPVYPPVTDAHVLCYNNAPGKALDTLRHVGNGVYIVKKKPLAGHTYTIKVQVGDLQLSATDTLPTSTSNLITIGDANKANPNQNPDITAFYNGKIAGNGIIWLGALLHRPIISKDTAIRTEAVSLLTYATVLDSFNSSLDPDYSQRNYRFIMRVRPEIIGTYNIAFTVFNSIKNVLDQNGSLEVFTFSASSNYDRYLKSSMVASENSLNSSEGSNLNPFYEPSNTFSNVQNGLGVFGSVVSSKRIFVK